MTQRNSFHRAAHNSAVQRHHAAHKSGVAQALASAQSFRNTAAATNAAFARRQAQVRQSQQPPKLNRSQPAFRSTASSHSVGRPGAAAFGSLPTSLPASVPSKASAAGHSWSTSSGFTTAPRAPLVVRGRRLYRLKRLLFLIIVVGAVIAILGPDRTVELVNLGVDRVVELVDREVIPLIREL